ncbi:MAG TPA: EI24 domain-containing protein [Stellaceae bacterium]|nr:EI24 domain-containing protein [Stellaceae bacterium]
MPPLLATVSQAFRDAFAPAQRRALIGSILSTLAVFAGLHLAVSWAIEHVRPEKHPWLLWPLEILGNFAILALTWLLFPAVATAILSLFLDRVLARLEAQHYPGLPPSAGMPLGAVLASGGRLLGLTIGLNLLALPIYLLAPAINPLLFYGVNGYLLGREYFDLVALRRLDGVAATALWRERRGRWLLAGVAIAALLSLPIVNLAAPLVAAAFMLHLVTEASGLAASSGHDRPKTFSTG